MARWTKAYKDRLKDDAFLYIEPGGRIDKTGRTTPRRLRHLPVFDLRGILSLSHVKSVLGSYGQRAKIPAHAKAEAMAFAQSLLHHGGKTANDTSSGPTSGTRTRGAHCTHCAKKITGARATIHAPGKPDKHYHTGCLKHRGKRGPSMKPRAARAA
jgi:hypothetical protein